jgi:hypothetical protein
VPNSLKSFPHKAKEVCLEMPKKYSESLKKFTNRALSHSKVDLSWDKNIENPIYDKLFSKETN